MLDSSVTGLLTNFAEGLTSGPQQDLLDLIDQGWEAFYREIHGDRLVDALDSLETADTHHSEAIIWHWEARLGLLKGERPPDGHFVYFPTWSRANMKCIAAGTPVLMGDGSTRPIEKVRAGDLVCSMEEGAGKVVVRPVVAQWKPGAKECVEVTTRGGRKTVSTPDHWYRTLAGWKQARDLTKLDRIASPRSVPAPPVDHDISDAEIRLLTYFLMEGGTTGGNSRLTSADPEIVSDMVKCCSALGFTIVKVKGDNYDYNVKRGTPLLERDQGRFIRDFDGVKSWLIKHGLAGKKSTEKRLPELFFKLSDRQIRMVLAAVIDTDGWVGKSDWGVTLANEALIDDLRELFLKIGLLAKKYYLHNDKAGSWCLQFDKHKLERFFDVPFLLKGERFRKLAERQRYSLLDTYPQSVACGLPPGTNRRLRREIGWKPSYACPRITRDKIQRALTAFRWGPWIWLENAEVFWDEVVSVEPIGERETYDIEVEGTHNFIADGLVVHNTTIGRAMLLTDALLSYAYGQPGYALIPGGTKAKIKGTAMSVEKMLYSPQVQRYCPALSKVDKNVMGRSRGWTADYISTAARYTFHFIGLDEGVAGANLDNVRPTFIMPDDIDSREDSPVISETRFKIFTTEVLPTRQQNTLVYWAQNLISRFSVRYRIEKQHVQVLTNRKPTTPIPAVRGLVTEKRTVDGIVKDMVVAGNPTWRGWTLQRVQDEIDTYGLPAFRAECQHEVEQSREGLVLHNWRDEVHVISESEFEAAYGFRPIPKHWPKEWANDWARTKTRYHANVALWKTVSPQSSKLPGMTFIWKPLSFPADSQVEDVAERLLECLTPGPEINKQVVGWRELRRQELLRANALQHTSTSLERIEYERSSLAGVFPRYVPSVLAEYNVRGGCASHERNDIRDIYARVYAMPVTGVNPGKFGGVEALNRAMATDWEAPHPFRPEQKGYTRWFLIAPDDLSASAQIRNGVAVRPPVPFVDNLSPDALHDVDLFRYQMVNWRQRPASLTATGEIVDDIEKANDDYGNALQMGETMGPLKNLPLTKSEEFQALIPDEIRALQNDGPMTKDKYRAIRRAVWDAEEQLEEKYKEHDKSDDPLYEHDPYWYGD